MTIAEAINKITERRPNDYTHKDFVQWLSRCDGMIKRNVIDTHEDGDAVDFHGYDGTTPMDTKLIVKEPYDGLYEAWLEAQVALADGDIDNYNTAITQYNVLYSEFANEYNRLVLPKYAGRFRF